MKHGDKAKAKSATAKASRKKASRKESDAESKGAAKKVSSKASKASKASPQKTSSKASAAIKASSTADRKGDNGKGKAGRNGPPDVFTFTNPVVGSAFKRAVKKFPTAFRRLTD